MTKTRLARWPLYTAAVFLVLTIAGIFILPSLSMDVTVGGIPLATNADLITLAGGGLVLVFGALSFLLRTTIYLDDVTEDFTVDGYAVGAQKNTVKPSLSKEEKKRAAEEAKAKKIAQKEATKSGTPEVPAEANEMINAIYSAHEVSGPVNNDPNSKDDGRVVYDLDAFLVSEQASITPAATVPTAAVPAASFDPLDEGKLSAILASSNAVFDDMATGPAPATVPSDFAATSTSPVTPTKSAQEASFDDMAGEPEPVEEFHTLPVFGATDTKTSTFDIGPSFTDADITAATEDLTVAVNNLAVAEHELAVAETALEGTLSETVTPVSSPVTTAPVTDMEAELIAAYTEEVTNETSHTQPVNDTETLEKETMEEENITSIDAVNVENTATVGVTSTVETVTETVTETTYEVPAVPDTAVEVEVVAEVIDTPVVEDVTVSSSPLETVIAEPVAEAVAETAVETAEEVTLAPAVIVDEVILAVEEDGITEAVDPSIEAIVEDVTLEEASITVPAEVQEVSIEDLPSDNAPVEVVIETTPTLEPIPSMFTEVSPEPVVASVPVEVPASAETNIVAPSVVEEPVLAHTPAPLVVDAVGESTATERVPEWVAAAHVEETFVAPFTVAAPEIVTAVPVTVPVEEPVAEVPVAVEPIAEEIDFIPVGPGALADEEIVSPTESVESMSNFTPAPSYEEVPAVAMAVAPAAVVAEALPLTKAEIRAQRKQDAADAKWRKQAEREAAKAAKIAARAAKKGKVVATDFQVDEYSTVPADVVEAAAVVATVNEVAERDNFDTVSLEPVELVASETVDFTNPVANAAAYEEFGYDEEVVDEVADEVAVEEIVDEVADEVADEEFIEQTIEEIVIEEAPTAGNDLVDRIASLVQEVEEQARAKAESDLRSELDELKAQVAALMKRDENQ